MIQKILNTQTKKISFASLILAGSYLFSAALGLLRDRLLAGRFGAGNELDVYYVAFTVPDFVALVLISGAISAAVIPIFNSYYVKSKDEGWQYISALLNIFLTFLILVCLALMILSPFFVSLVAPGFSESKKAAAVLLMRIMFLSPIIFGVSNIISGILQVFHRFLVTALAPIMYNLGIIAGILFLAPMFGLPGLAAGVILGALMHLLIQVPSFFYSGFRYKKIFDIYQPGIIKTLKLMAPRSLGLAAGQLNTIIITAIASTLAIGSVAIFNLANNLSSVAVNAVSVSLSTAIFPAMSFLYSSEDRKGFERKFSEAFRQIIFLTVPISILIFVLRAQIVRVVLGTGKFNWLDTRLTAACLGIFSLGLFAQGLVFLLSKTFYAVHNTKIPALISFVTVVFNVTISLVFVRLLNYQGALRIFFDEWLKLQGIKNISVIGLVLALTITAVAEASLLLFFLYKKFDIFRLKDFSECLWKIFISGSALFLAAFFVRQELIYLNVVKLQTFWGVFMQLIFSAFSGVIAYVLVSYILKSRELKTIKESFLKNGRTGLQ